MKKENTKEKNKILLAVIGFILFITLSLLVGLIHAHYHPEGWVMEHSKCEPTEWHYEYRCSGSFPRVCGDRRVVDECVNIKWTETETNSFAFGISFVLAIFVLPLGVILLIWYITDSCIKEEEERKKEWETKIKKGEVCKNCQHYKEEHDKDGCSYYWESGDISPAFEETICCSCKKFVPYELKKRRSS